MELETNNSKNKVSYDARLHFSKDLVRRTHVITTLLTTGDHHSAKLEMYHFYTVVNGKLSQKESEKVEQLFKEIEDLKFNNKPTNFFKPIDPTNEPALIKFPDLLMKLQKYLFFVTSELMLISAESDEETEFNEGEL